MPFSRDIEIVSLLASPQHRYEGRPSDGPRDATTRESFDTVEVRAGLGIVGDRYFGQRAHVSASVTVMAIESLEGLGLGPLNPLDTRRNIITRGLDIDAMRGEEFSLDGILFRANRPANPCAWMNVAIADGAHKGLRGQGGLRGEPLSDGILRVGPATLTVVPSS